MRLQWVPLLQLARDLHDIPRGMERFKSYLETITQGLKDDIALPPLVTMNPMGKEHVAARIDELLALGAEEVAVTTLQEAAQRLPSIKAELKVGLVVADDIGGGWTNRYLTDTSYRFQHQSNLKRGWATVLWWVSETPTRARVQEEVLASVYRALYQRQHGEPKTLRQMMAQEGLATLFAGQTHSLDAEDVAYTREVMQPYLDRVDFPVAFACLYGDEAAHAVGYRPIGLSAGAGYAVALEDAHQRGLAPETALFNPPTEPPPNTRGVPL